MEEAYNTQVLPNGVRIVTERSVLAMPEVGIGFMPDVGGTYLLGRAGPVGTLLAKYAPAECR